jgi:hypothetical protein
MFYVLDESSLQGCGRSADGEIASARVNRRNGIRSLTEHAYPINICHGPKVAKETSYRMERRRGCFGVAVELFADRFPSPFVAPALIVR